MTSRTWFKIYADKWLTGTIRDETPATRGIFVDLLALAGGGEFGDTGVISLKNGVGFNDLQLQKILKVSKSEWRNAKKRLISSERIAINPDNIITILNWKKYQSEYERQKIYRNPKLQKEVTTESNTGDRDRDRERDIKENIIKEKMSPDAETEIPLPPTENPQTKIIKDNYGEFNNVLSFFLGT